MPLFERRLQRLPLLRLLLLENRPVGEDDVPPPLAVFDDPEGETLADPVGGRLHAEESHLGEGAEPPDVAGDLDLESALDLPLDHPFHGDPAARGVLEKGPSRLAGSDLRREELFIALGREEIGADGLTLLDRQITLRIQKLPPIQIPFVFPPHVDEDPLRRDLHDDRLHALARLQPAAIRLTLIEQFGETLLAAFLFQFLIRLLHGSPYA